MDKNNPCPCGAGKKFIECCGLYIQKKLYPKTPEALMRSRYTAYTLANIDYICETQKDKVAKNFDKKDALE